MIVAVFAMRVVQMIADPVIDMVAMRHRVMAAAGTVNMTGFMPGAAMVRGAAFRVLARHREHVLVAVIAVRVVQMAVVQVIDMAVMAHGLMPAAGAVAMIVFRVDRVCAIRLHVCSFLGFGRGIRRAPRRDDTVSPGSR